MPVHGEGSAVRKELEATKDILMKSKTYSYIYREPLSGGSGGSEPDKNPLTLKTTDSTVTGIDPHHHEVTLTPDEVEAAQVRGKTVTLQTTPGSGHQHVITVIYRRGKWRIKTCSSK